ncbi:F0F1 ATP synthase subunit epsilon [Sulfitobacter donghicola]|uniref:ATP synthase epsilon chain n=1 Tax=Sulfitobacter donghicola DSW-25 = KCTC 12864 = JCM 14565 TaxID=1300350 RepID=A0A073IGW4_9RHOB|nr:F0F1 ATP synthase subunit epsilon [Sulfitobacter donghicola]KEJ88815.1 F0F1 ATP synthase subunit epsilon [Sulfitobacter donghicola DSW-25 = KCTC 12864 = JCM 14565]KIN68610.1 ATP synthase epsilon chain [Sulfitobacter donghicola DSW-25 = KCTC 12864 = JCM 14565]
MADTMQFDLVSPERRLASAQVVSVQIPGTDGELTAMPGHSATITTLRPGILTVDGPDGPSEYVVTGGFAEITAKGVSVLAERAIAKSDMTQETMDEIMEEAKNTYSKVKEEFENEAGPVDDAARLLSDMVAMGAHMGLTAEE